MCGIGAGSIGTEVKVKLLVGVGGEHTKFKGKVLEGGLPPLIGLDPLIDLEAEIKLKKFPNGAPNFTVTLFPIEEQTGIVLESRVIQLEY